MERNCVSSLEPSSLSSQLTTTFRRPVPRRNISLDGIDLKLYQGPVFMEYGFGVEVSSVPSHGRGFLQRRVTTNKCICDRPRVKIICQACGFLTEGRVRVECSVHKNVSENYEMVLCCIMDCFILDYYIHFNKIHNFLERKQNNIFCIVY